MKHGAQRWETFLEGGEGGLLPMHVVPKVLSMRSGGIESVEVDWVSWMVSGESAWISIIIT